MKFVPILVPTAAALAITLAVAPGCQQDHEVNREFPRADDAPRERVVSDIRYFQLDNGVSVYLQEEHSYDRVAIEVFYRAGLFKEPAGKPQLAHITEHLLIHGATASYQPDEALAQIKKYGQAAAETVGDCAHYDYIVPSEKLDEVLGIEVERLTSAKFHADVLKNELANVAIELRGVADRGEGTITKYGVMALNQILVHGINSVPVRNGIGSITVEDAVAFHDANYRPDDMVIVLIGEFKSDDAEKLVRKHFEPLKRRPAPPAVTVKAGRKHVDATWDLNNRSVWLVSAGPYPTQRERLIMMLFGAFLRNYMANTPDLTTVTVTVYASNPVYPVYDMPFFVLGQPTGGVEMSYMSTIMRSLLTSAFDLIEEKLHASILANAELFVTSSSLGKIVNIQVPHQNVIGQAALDIGLKHYFREGMPVDEFIAFVHTITLEEFRSVVRKNIADDRLVEVWMTP